jgi:general secretion pathway protein F
MTSASSQFVYLALKPDGGKKLGVVRGRDARQATDQLRRQRMVPLQTWALPSWAGGGERTSSLKDQAELHLQLSQLLGRGVPLVEALDVTTRSVSRATQPKVERMREFVASGSSFADACQKVGMFDSVTIAVYRAAERTGDLGGAAKQLSTMARRQLGIRGKVGTLMAYPLIVLSISVLASLFLLVYLVPKVGAVLQEQLASQGRALPLFTRVTMSVGVFIRDQWLWCLLALAVLVTLGVMGRGVLARVLSGAARRTPALREVILAQESARFFTVMASMTRTGIPLADALGVAVGVLGHPTLRAQLTTLRTRLIEGGVLRQLIENVTALPAPTRRLLIAAERSGDLESVFDTLGQDTAEELDRRSTRLLAALEPLLIVLMAAMIGTLLLSIMIPMLSISGQVA